MAAKAAICFGLISIWFRLFNDEKGMFVILI